MKQVDGMDVIGHFKRYPRNACFAMLDEIVWISSACPLVSTVVGARGAPFDICTEVTAPGTEAMYKFAITFVSRAARGMCGFTNEQKQWLEDTKYYGMVIIYNPLGEDLEAYGPCAAAEVVHSYRPILPINREHFAMV